VLLPLLLLLTPVALAHPGVAGTVDDGAGQSRLPGDGLQWRATYAGGVAQVVRLICVLRFPFIAYLGVANCVLN
jgi:hypothetical protein